MGLRSSFFRCFNTFGLKMGYRLNLAHWNGKVERKEKMG